MTWIIVGVFVVGFLLFVFYHRGRHQGHEEAAQLYTNQKPNKPVSDEKPGERKGEDKHDDKEKPHKPDA